MTGVGEPGPVPVQRATENFFAVIRVRPVLGRVFRAEEGQEQASNGCHQQHLLEKQVRQRPECARKDLSPQGVSVSTVVGVMPAGFEAFEQWYRGKSVDIWEPVNPESAKYASRLDRGDDAGGALKPGVTLARAQVEMDVIARGLEQAYPNTNKGVRGKSFPIVRHALRPRGRPSSIHCSEQLVLSC